MFAWGPGVAWGRPYHGYTLPWGTPARIEEFPRAEHRSTMESQVGTTNFPSSDFVRPARRSEGGRNTGFMETTQLRSGLDQFPTYPTNR
jgi:hypothetical protein